MRRLGPPLLAAAASLAIGAPSPLRAEPVGYAEAHCSDIISGYVPDGSRVSTKGHLFVEDGRFALSPALMSARVPLPVATGRITDASLAALARRCHSPARLTGGCAAVIRGVVRLGPEMPDEARPVVLEAEAIEVRPADGPR